MNVCIHANMTRLGLSSNAKRFNSRTLGKGSFLPFLHAIYWPLHSHLRPALPHTQPCTWSTSFQRDKKPPQTGLGVVPHFGLSSHASFSAYGCASYDLQAGPPPPRFLSFWPSEVRIPCLQKDSGTCRPLPCIGLGGSPAGCGVQHPLLKLTLLCLSRLGVGLVPSNISVTGVFLTTPPGMSRKPGTAAPGRVRLLPGKS